MCMVSSPEELPIEFRPTKFGLVSWVVPAKHSQEARTCEAAAVSGGFVEFKCKLSLESGCVCVCVAGRLQTLIHVPINPESIHNFIHLWA